MKPTLLLFFSLIAISFSRAGEPDYRSYFVHPDAQISIRIGSAHSQAVPFKNHSIPKDANEVPGFQSGFGTSGERADSPHVHWRFVQKTEFGDLYLFDISKRDTLIKAFPVLYTGSSLVAYNHDDVHVTIGQTHPNAE